MAGGVINKSFQLSDETNYIYKLFKPEIELTL